MSIDEIMGQQKRQLIFAKLDICFQSVKERKTTLIIRLTGFLHLIREQFPLRTKTIWQLPDG